MILQLSALLTWCWQERESSWRPLMKFCHNWWQALGECLLLLVERASQSSATHAWFTSLWLLTAGFGAMVAKSLRETVQRRTMIWNTWAFVFMSLSLLVVQSRFSCRATWQVDGTGALLHLAFARWNKRPGSAFPWFLLFNNALAHNMLNKWGTPILCS